VGSAGRCEGGPTEGLPGRVWRPDRSGLRRRAPHRHRGGITARLGERVSYHREMSEENLKGLVTATLLAVAALLPIAPAAAQEDVGIQATGGPYNTRAECEEVRAKYEGRYWEVSACWRSVVTDKWYFSYR
jgi:hypothetical protein